MAEKELTALEIHEGTKQRIGSTKKWVRSLKFCFFGAMVAFIVALYTDDTRAAIIFLAAWTTISFLIMRHNQYQLILALRDELLAARELPMDNSKADEGE